MQDLSKHLLLTLLTVAVCVPLWAGDGNPSEENAATTDHESLTSATIKADGDAALSPALLGILVMKGVLTSAEANTLRGVPSSSGVAQLLNLLKEKGVVTDADLVQVNTAAAVSASLVTPSSPSPPSSQAASSQAPAAERPVIPAVAPLRVLPIDVPKPGGIIPDIKLGSGASMKLYGFYKASAISDTASSGGATFGSEDFPLPLLQSGGTGPTSDPQVRVKARSFRIGAQTEWVPKGSDFTITGRVEGDFEGDFTNVNNRNISGIRSSQFSIRLVWVRLDKKLGQVPWFAEFGQDWSLLSSTLPNRLRQHSSQDQSG